MGLGVRSPGQSETRIGREKDEKIANVNHAAWIVERLLVDRKSRVAGRPEQVQDLPQTRVERNRDDVGARQHDVGHPHVVQRQHVLQDGALLRRELRGGAFVDRILDVVADGAGRETEQPPQPLEQSRRQLPRGGGPRLSSLFVDRFAHSVTAPSA